jgi:pseudouridine-5'-phosphate glycosidase
VNILCRAKVDSYAYVALETTLLVHGVPPGHGAPLARELTAIIEAEGVHAVVVGVLGGRPIVGLNLREIDTLLNAAHVPKANTANLGVLMHRKSHAATTVSTTMELAAEVGVRVFATGGIGGVHRGYGARLDISADLAALARHRVAVVSSGVKTLLDVESTREVLETLGVPVVGWRTDRFPAFYRRESSAGVDARFDDIADLARFVRAELDRTGRGVLVVNPIPAEDEIAPADWDRWLGEAREGLDASGRDVTPRLLARLHEVSAGATLRANLALVRSNAGLAARLCFAMMRT